MSENPSIEFIYGNASILAELKNNKAHIMCVGDSISADMQGGFMHWPLGLLTHARPNAWEGCYINSSTGSGSATGTNSVITTNVLAESRTNVQPGQYFANTVDSTFDGNAARLFYVGDIKENSNASTQTIRLSFQKDRMFGDGPDTPTTSSAKPLINANGEFDFDSTKTYFGEAYILSRTDGILSSKDRPYLEVGRLRFQDDGSFDVSAQVNYDFNNLTPSHPSGLQAYKLSTGIHTPTDAVGNIELHFAGPSGDPVIPNNWPSAGGVHGHLGGMLRRADVTNGMWVTMSGYGSWKTGNHLYEWEDSRVPSVDTDGQNSNPPYPAAYTDQALETWIKVTDTNVFFLYIGTNDLWTTDGGEEVARKTVGIVNRYTRAAKNVGIENPRFIIMCPSCTQGSLSIYNEQKVYAEYIKNWVQTRLNIVFCDLQSYLDGLFDFSNPAASNEWSTNYTVDGTHPNVDGMTIMASSFFWNKVVEAYNARNFAYDKNIILRTDEAEKHLDTITLLEAKKSATVAKADVSSNSPYEIASQENYNALLAQVKRNK